MYGNYRTGPQRAAARAHFHGLTVGELVRADVQVRLWGSGDPQRPLVPLDFAQRLERYAGQACARQGAVGWRWRPTARQRRRLRHKANHTAAPFGRQVPGSYLNERVAAVPYAAEAGNTPPWPGTVPVQPRGFRLTDRRGEHRA